MKLTDYLERIHYKAQPKADKESLFALHEAHLRAIPYENLDIHLGREVKLDLQHIFNKLVHEKRGGWCFEMNSLLAWVLKEIGFEVTLLAAGVDKKDRGDSALFNHLLLLVQLEQAYLVDVGFGDGLLHPIPLQEGIHTQEFRQFELERLDDSFLRFHNHELGSAQTFDFTLIPRQITDFAEQCHTLQTSEESGFVRLNVCQIFTPEGIAILRGAILKNVTAQGVVDKTLETQEAFETTLKDTFGLDIGDTIGLWSSIWQKHQTWIRTLSQDIN